MNKLLILVGTMSGTAEMAACEMAECLEAHDVDARIVRMESASVAQVASAGLLIVCTSTYGTGNVPDNAKALYAALQAERPDLSRLRYGVFALGSEGYPNTFCFGGKRFDQLLSDLGAERIGERFQHGDRSGVAADHAAADWIEAWVGGVTLSAP